MTRTAKLLLIALALQVQCVETFASEPDSAILTANPEGVFADGIQTSVIMISDIKDVDGNPVPDGERFAVSVGRGTSIYYPALGTIEGGTENVADPRFRDFEVTGNTIVATYRSADVPLAPGQTLDANVHLVSLQNDGSPFRSIGSGAITLIGTNSATVSVNPEHVFADGIQTATVTVTDIRDLDGNPVPDGERFAVSVGRGSSIYYPAFGMIEGGTENVADSRFRDFEVTGNTIVATYRSADFPLAPGQTVDADVYLVSLRNDGSPFRSVGSGTITLIGTNSATVSTNPEHVYADGIQTATVTITDIRDLDGNPVPDGERFAVSVGRGSSIYNPLFGTIEGGTENVADSRFRDFEVTGNTIVATYRSADFPLAPGQTVEGTIYLVSLNFEGAPFRSVGTGAITLVGKHSAVITPNPDNLYADGIQTATITVTDIKDSFGTPVPDGVVCALKATNGYWLNSPFGEIEGGTPNLFDSRFQNFTIQNNSIVATYRSPDLGLSPGQTATATIHLVSLHSDGRVFRPTSSGTVSLAGIQDTDNDGVPDPEDNCPDDFNPLQEDFDLDGPGDVCDPDDDNDGVTDLADNCPLDANPLQRDFDLDGLGNACDDSFGGDGIIQELETLILQMRDIIVAVNPPGGNGMIAKLAGKGGILSKVVKAVNAFASDEIDINTYMAELDGALAMLNAFVNQLEGKIGNGEFPELEGGYELRLLSEEVRVFVEVLQ